MSDYTLADRKLNIKRGWERVCDKCHFVIPEHEWKRWKECGQCGSKLFHKVKIQK